MRFRVLFFVLLVSTFGLHAQRTFEASAVAGINGCQIHGDSYSGFDQIGFVAGVFVHNHPGQTWQGQFGIQYSRKGSRHVLNPDQGGYRDFELRLSYVEVPFMVRYNSKKVFFDLGLTAAVLFKVREWDTQERIPPQEFKKMEFGITGGIGYNLSEIFFIEFTTTHSLIPIKDFSVPMYYQRWFSNLFNKGMYNNIVGLTIGMRFTSKQND